MGRSDSRKRTICVVTGGRTDYGQLFWLMDEIRRDPDLKLQVVATGMHLSRRYGSTVRRVEADGFRIDAAAPVLRYDDSESGIAKTIGLGCRLFADIFRRLRPNLVVILGDRFEMLSAAIAAYVGKFPIAHIHGGETSQGAMDEGFRHAITKMAQVHFPAHEVYRRRIVQLGEDPRRVFNFGSLGLETLHRTPLFKKEELEKRLKMDLDGPAAVFTYHPATLEKNSAARQIECILNAVGRFDLKVIFTKTNADTDGRIINRVIQEFCRKNPARYKLFDSLGHAAYLSCLRHCSVVIGNSSSGIIEAASFKIPVVNIGDRQKGRMRTKNIIDVRCSETDIVRGLKKALSQKFRTSLKKLQNPYDKYRDGHVARRMKDRLKRVELDEGIIKKEFFDLKINERHS